MSKYFLTEEVFEVNPDSVVFDEDYVKMNAPYLELEYIATKLSIEEKGQLSPILYLNGRCVDGRHRTKICKELGRKVKVKHLNPTLEPKEIMELCLLDSTTGRQYSATQRAVLVYKMVKKFGYTDVEASKRFQVRPQLLSYAAKIAEYGREDILEALFEGKAVILPNMEKSSKSLEYLCKKAKELNEMKVIENDEEKIHFNPDALIKTEAAKDWYYNLIRSGNVTEEQVSVRLALIELANLKFKESE